MISPSLPQLLDILWALNCICDNCPCLCLCPTCPTFQPAHLQIFWSIDLSGMFVHWAGILCWAMVVQLVNLWGETEESSHSIMRLTSLLCSVFNWVVCFVLVLICMIFLYVFNINISYICLILLDVSFPSIFSYLVSCLFILLIVTFNVKKFLVWYNPTCLFFLLLPLLEET